MLRFQVHRALAVRAIFVRFSMQPSRGEIIMRLGPWVRPRFYVEQDTACPVPPLFPVPTSARANAQSSAGASIVANGIAARQNHAPATRLQPAARNESCKPPPPPLLPSATPLDFCMAQRIFDFPPTEVGQSQRKTIREFLV